VAKSQGQTRNKAAAAAAARKAASASSRKPAAPAATSSTKVGFGTTGEWIAFVFLNILIFLVPIAISNLAWLGLGTFPFSFDQFDLVKVTVQRVCLFIALGALGWSWLTRGGTLRRTAFDWLILAFLAWVLLTSIFSIHPPTAFFGKYRRLEGFFSFVAYAAMFWLTVQLADKPSKMRFLARTLVFSSVLVAGYGLLQYVGADPIKWGALPFEANRAFSFYGNPDLLGGFLMFPLPIALAMALSERNDWWRVFYWVAFVMNLGVWIIAFVRGAWIGGAVSLAILVAAAIWFRLRPRVVDWAAVGMAVLAAAFFVLRSLSAPTEVMNVLKRLLSIFETDKGSALTRFEIWSAALKAIQDRPIFGFGADTFRLLFPKYKPAAYTKDAGYLSVADNVHNYPLQLTTGVGIPGTLMFYGLVGWVLVRSARYAFARDAGETRIMYTGFWAAAVGYVVHLFFGLSVTGSTIFLWLILGLLAAPFARNVEFKAPNWGAIGALAVAVLAAFGVLASLWYQSADYYYLLARIGPLTPEQKIAAIDEAIRRNPYNDMYRAELGLRLQESFIGRASQAQMDAQAGKDPTAAITQAKKDFDIAEQAMLSVIDFVPYEYDNYVFLANLYNQAGSIFRDPAFYRKAVEIGKRGITVEPFGPAIQLQTALAYASLHEYPQAEELLNRAIKLDPAFSEPYMILADIQQRTGRKAEAKKTIEKAIKLFPGNAQFTNALQSLASSQPLVPSIP
jgi:putative inorganic carbon (HCO3(-)) transporter